MNDYPEAEDIRQVSPERLRKLIKHLGRAAEGLKKEKKVESRKDFLGKIEELSGETMAHHEPEENLSGVELKLNRLEEIDKATIQAQKQDEAEISRLQEAVRDDEEDIDSMQAKVQLLEKRLAESELRRIRQLKDSKEKMLALTHMLSDLNLKLGMIGKKKTVKSPEVKAIKSKLSSLEAMHKKLKKSKKHSKSDLLRVEKKIKELKTKV